MQVCDVTVLHGGRQEMTIRKRGVSVAEIAVLRHIHGQDAVREITLRGNSRQPHNAEIARLKGLYPGSPDAGSPIEALWPGHAPKLPEHLEEIGLAKDSPFLGEPPKAVPNEEPPTAQVLEIDGGDGNDEGAEAAEPAKTKGGKANPLAASAAA